MSVVKDVKYVLLVRGVEKGNTWARDREEAIRTFKALLPIYDYSKPEVVVRKMDTNPMKQRKKKRSRSTGARVKAAARKITQQIRALKLKRRKLHRGR